MKRRRWLPVAALAAVGTSSLMACIVSIDEGRIYRPDSGIPEQTDGSIDGAPAGGSTDDVVNGDANRDADADADAAPSVYVCGDGAVWDGASPALIVFHGVAFADHIHVDIVDGAGPAFHVHVGDKNMPIANGAELDTFAPCTTSFDDYGSSHPGWGVAEGGLQPRYDFIYQLMIYTAAEQQDPNWTYEPGIDVETMLADGGPTDRNDVLATCPIGANMCSQVPP